MASMAIYRILPHLWPKPGFADAQELISHITHLHNLLKNLPSSLPSNPGTAGVVHGLKEPDDHNIAMEDDCPDD